MLETVSLSRCDYFAKQKKLTMSSEVVGMPKELFIQSHKTGKEFRFVAVGPSDVLYDEDQWDGEQQIYRPTASCDTIDYLVIYNQY